MVWSMNFIFPYIGKVIILTDFHIFQGGRSTTNQLHPFGKMWAKFGKIHGRISNVVILVDLAASQESFGRGVVPGLNQEVFHSSRKYLGLGLGILPYQSGPQTIHKLV
jgi:hypothetical protein